LLFLCPVHSPSPTVIPRMGIGCTRAPERRPVRLSQKSLTAGSWPAVPNPRLMLAPPGGGLRPALEPAPAISDRTGMPLLPPREAGNIPYTARPVTGPSDSLCASPQPAMLESSNLRPGPIVELRHTFLTKVPLTPGGLDRLIAPTKARTFSSRACSVKLA